MIKQVTIIVLVIATFVGVSIYFNNQYYENHQPAIECIASDSTKSFTLGNGECPSSRGAINA